MRGWKLIATTVAVLLTLSCGGCALSGSLGVRPYNAGFVAECRGAEGCEWGLEAGGWRVGLSAFPDVGPLEDEDADQAEQ